MLMGQLHFLTLIQTTSLLLRSEFEKEIRKNSFQAQWFEKGILM